MHNRRKLVIALGVGALAAPFGSLAQQQAKLWRIGFLGTASASGFGFAERVEAFRSGLRDFGYVEGRNLVIEFRWAEDRYEQLPKLAAELVGLKVDVIVTHGTGDPRGQERHCDHSHRHGAQRRPRCHGPRCEPRAARRKCQRVGHIDTIGTCTAPTMKLAIISILMFVALQPMTAAQNVFKDCADCPEMVAIAAGRFVMGAAPGEEEREGLAGEFRNRSQPQHAVDVKSFAAGKFEVTRGQYRVFAEATGRATDGCFVWTGAGFEQGRTKDWRNPGYAQDDLHPVACVSWDDAGRSTAHSGITSGHGSKSPLPVRSATCWLPEQTAVCEISERKRLYRAKAVMGAQTSVSCA